MRYYCSGILTGMGIGMAVGGFLDRKMGWTAEDPHSLLLLVLLVFAGVVVGELDRRKRKC
jgi:hypothetical protein